MHTVKLGFAGRLHNLQEPSGFVSSMSSDPFQVWRPVMATHTKSIAGGQENPIAAHVLKLVCTVNPEYFVRTQFSCPGLSDPSYAWNFRTVADRCGFSDLLCTFRLHFIFARKPPCTKYTKITCIRNILDLQYMENSDKIFSEQDLSYHSHQVYAWQWNST